MKLLRITSIGFFPKHMYFISILAPIFISFLLYKFTFNFFFFQDDFFHLRISKAENFNELLNFFKFRNDIIGYRPVTIQFYFSLLYGLFKLNPLVFRIFNFLIFIGAFFLIIETVYLISKKKIIGLITASLWILSSIHFMTLTWISASYQLIGTFFWLLTSQFFLKFVEKSKVIYYLLSLGAFFLTIFSFEFSVTWPVIFFTYFFLVLRNEFIKSIKIFSPFIVVTIFYLILRYLFKEVPQIEDYRFQININSFKAFFWYFLWALNVPEEFKYQIINNLVLLNKKFLSDFWLLTIKSYIGVVLIIVLGIIVPIIKSIRSKLELNLRLIIFTIIWFIIGIAPVLVIPKHTFLMYLTLPSIGIYLLIAYLVVKLRNIKLIFALFVVWIFTSITTLTFYKNHSYMNEAQKFSKQFYYQIKNKFPSVQPSSIIFYPLTNKTHIQALSNQNAIKVIYNDLSIEIYFNEDDLKKRLIQDKKNYKVFKYQ